MQRDASRYLDSWLTRERRLPLIVRGARQVGKTWIVRDLAERHELDLVECNFERVPELAGCFTHADPRRVLSELELALDRRIDVDGALLFIDEVQAAGEVLASLRWFAEELPELPVVAAGSLLEFTLADHDFSMPVGRVGYLHLDPLSFPEYLRAHSLDPLLDSLTAWEPGATLSDVAHERATEWFMRYCAVGGLPAVVRADVETDDPREVRRLQSDLLATYRDDFAKYAGRMDPDVLDRTLLGVARQLGTSFTYSHVDPDLRHSRVKSALELLCRARLCHLVRHTAARSVPLAGETKTRSRKVVLLDTGLAQSLLGLPAATTPSQVAPAVRGALAEQALAQQLLTLREWWEEPRLFYWQRGGGRPGEIDYVVQRGARIVPVEAKSGAPGSLKSLHQFVHERGMDIAVRVHSAPPTIERVSVKTTTGKPVEYTLLSIPHHLAWRAGELIDTVQ